MNTKYLRQLLFRFLSVSAVLLLALSPFGGVLAKGPTTFVVNTTNDVDDGVCNKAHCSLREAINAANAHSGADIITFNIRGGPPFTIQPLSALPEITDPVTIDGSTQRGYAGRPIVELDGSNAGAGEPDVGISGLVIEAGSSTVKGLVINRFSGDGIVLTAKGGNRIEGNFIGTDVTGTLALSNGIRGIFITGGSSDNLIGGTGAHARNLVSGNARAGVRLDDTEGNLVQGNFIGTDINGMRPLGNEVGVKIMGAANNMIGGTEASARNLISGNAFYGVFIATEGTTGNIVQGNYIGTDVTGSIATIPAGPPVGEYTLTVMPETCPTYDAETDFEGAFDHFISESNDPLAPWSGTSVHFFGSDVCTGREMLGEASLIYRYKLEFAELTRLTSIAVSGANFNGPHNVMRVLDEHMNVLGFAPTFGQNEWSKSYIDLQGIEGTIFYIDEFDTSTTWRYRQSITINEAVPLGNLADGVFISASDNLIVGNLISGNMWFGVEILEPGATGNTLQGNLIGTDARGTTSLPNAFSGVLIGGGASDTLIGGVDEGAGNVISGNGYIGVEIADPGATSNVVQGNRIGTDASGTTALPNAGAGVWIGREASDTLIGGVDEGAGNLISGNEGAGVQLAGVGTEGNKVQGNYIGTDLTGASPLGNLSGVWVTDGAADNLIGGTEDGARNVISGNVFNVVFSEGVAATGNTVQGNYIGTDRSGSVAIADSVIGVLIYHDETGNLIGGTDPGAGNLISGNSYWGVLISGGGATGNLVQGNFIGTDATGTEPLGNSPGGVLIDAGAADNTIGGTEPGAGNLISGNEGDGVVITDPGTTGNTVQGNFIGMDATGTIPLGNSPGGVLIDASAADNTIGGTEPGAGNLISGNKGDGVVITDPGTTGNTVQGNFLGTDVTGSTVTVPAGPDPGDFEVTVDEACPTYLAGTEIEGWVSESDDPLDPWSGISVLFEGTDRCDLETLGEASLIYRYRLDFPADTQLTSIVVTGGNFIGPDNTLRVLDENMNVLGTTATFENPYIMLNGVSGNVFYIEEYDTSSEYRFRQSIVVNGPVPLGNAGYGVVLAAGASDNLIGGTDPGARNLISGNNGDGVAILDIDTTGNKVQGNFIGTDVTGTVALGNLSRGIIVEGGPTGNFIGGSQPHAGNLISGNELAGIGLFSEGTEGNQIQGNFIGTDIGGMNPLGNGVSNGLPGVRIGEGAANNLVGGTEPSAGNTIAFNGGPGIALSDDAGSGNSFLSNSMFLNEGLGIDLGFDDVTPNDPLDGDAGPNDLQNYPIITAVRRVGGAVMIYGTLESTPSTKFRLEFFSNVECDPSGNGEGQAFLGSAHVRTDHAGFWNFIITLPVTLPQGAYVTATATNPGGSTSEFSACFRP